MTTNERLFEMQCIRRVMAEPVCYFTPWPTASKELLTVISLSIYCEAQQSISFNRESTIRPHHGSRLDCVLGTEAKLST